MLPRQDPRDAVVSVDPPAFVEAAEQVNTDLTIGLGVGNAQSSAKRARTVNCSGTALTSIDSYDKSLHDEMERYFAVPLDQFALDQLTADLGAENSSAAGFSTGNVLDEWTAELEAQENSSASGFSTGNAVGRSIEDTQLWSADDEKALMITPIGQQAAGSVSSLWQHLSLAVFAVLGFSSLFEHTSALNSSMQAGSLTGTQFVLERIWPLLWLGLGGLVAAAGYRYLPTLTQHSLRQLSVDANDTHSKEEIS